MYQVRLSDNTYPMMSRLFFSVRLYNLRMKQGIEYTVTIPLQPYGYTVMCTTKQPSLFPLNLSSPTLRIRDEGTNTHTTTWYCRSTLTFSKGIRKPKSFWPTTTAICSSYSGVWLQGKRKCNFKLVRHANNRFSDYVLLAAPQG